LPRVKAEFLRRFSEKRTSVTRVKTNSQKGGYQKRVRKVYGPKHIEKVPLSETFENKRLGKALAVAKVRD
jgi:hypothetical protein